jgi:hypothetical protein
VAVPDAVDTYDYQSGRPVADQDPVLIEPVSGEFTSLNPQNTGDDVANYLSQLGANL